MRSDAPMRWFRCGVTFVESAVVVVVIAVLIAIMLPSLRFAREVAREAALKSDLRSVADAFTSYSADHTGLLPHFQLPRSFGGDPWTIWPLYFDMHRYWPTVVGPYMGLEVNDPVFRPEPEEAWSSTLLMPCVFLAEPSFWDPTRRTLGGAQIVPPRLDATRYPSDKAIAVYQPLDDAPQAKLDVVAAFVDRSAATVTTGRQVAGYPRGDGATHTAFGAVHFNDNPPMLHTLEGVLGRDRE